MTFLGEEWPLLVRVDHKRRFVENYHDAKIEYQLYTLCEDSAKTHLGYVQEYNWSASKFADNCLVVVT